MTLILFIHFYASVRKDNSNNNFVSTPINIENVEHNNIVSPPTFASKVKQSLKL